jgi:hypothetical protein
MGEIEMINQLFVNVFKAVAITTLFILLTTAVCFGVLVAVFCTNSHWAAPLVLSPSQEKVLSYQPQVAMMEENILKQRVDLTTAEATLRIGTEQLADLEQLIVRVGGAQRVETHALSITDSQLKNILSSKNVDLRDTEQQLTAARSLLKTTDEELAAGVITKDEAESRRVALQTALNSFTDSKASAVQLNEQERQASSAVQTFKGGSSSLQALQTVETAAQIKAIAAQVSVNNVTAKDASIALKTAIAQNQHVIDVAKASPYYRALTGPVTVAFVPYDNLKYAKVGTVVYDCYLEVFLCHQVGTIVKVFQAEEYARHPLFKTDTKGQLIEIYFDDIGASTSDVVFFGRKPFLIL